MFDLYLSGIDAQHVITTGEESHIKAKVAQAIGVSLANVYLLDEGESLTNILGGRRLIAAIDIEFKFFVFKIDIKADGVPRATAQLRLETAVKSGSLKDAIAISGALSQIDNLYIINEFGDVINLVPKTVQTGGGSPQSTFQSGQGSTNQANEEVGNSVKIEKGKVGKLPDSEVATVYVVFGLKEEAPFEGTELGDPIYDGNFDISRKSCQEAFVEIYETAKENADLKIREPGTMLADLNVYLRVSQRLPGLPTEPGSDFHRHIRGFLRDQRGRPHVHDVGFDPTGTTVKWIRARFKTELPIKMPASQAEEYMENWNSYLERLNAKYGGAGTGKIFHTSDLWLRIETEMRLVNSTLLCAAFSVLFALALVMLFLWNVALGVYLVLGIVCVIICMASIMFGVIGWQFGAVEAVGLIVFVGFSVDYSLHMAESYNMAKQKDRFGKVQDALRRTGGAVLAAGTTSMLAGIPILICTIQAFVKFGATIVLNTALSLFWSLVFLSALLMLIGPIDNFGSCDYVCGSCGEGDEEEKEDTSVVPGRVMGVGNTGNTEATGMGGAPAEYRWDTGDGGADDDLKKDEKGAAQAEAAATEAAETTQVTTVGDLDTANPEAAATVAPVAEIPQESEQVLDAPNSPPSTVVAATRESPRADVSPQTMGRTADFSL